MKILYDSQAFDMQRHGGVSRCFVELYKHLPKDIEATFSVVETDNVYLNNIGVPPVGHTYQQFLWKGNDPAKKFLYKLYYNCKFGQYKKWDCPPQLNLAKSIKQIKERIPSF